jgi:hypothetical protein
VPCALLSFAPNRRVVEKKTSEFYKLFDNEISVVKKAFDAMRRSPPKSPILVSMHINYRGTLQVGRHNACIHTLGIALALLHRPGVLGVVSS